MKKFILSLGLVLGSFLLLTSCGFIGNCLEGQGSIVIQEISIASFSAIELHSPARVYLKQSDNQSVTIKAQQNIIDMLKMEVDGEKWKIRFDRCPKTDKKIEIYINLPKLTEAEIDGSGELISDGVFESDELELNIEGSGSINFELDVKELETEVNGSGDLMLSGKSKLLLISR